MLRHTLWPPSSLDSAGTSAGASRRICAQPAARVYRQPRVRTAPGAAAGGCDMGNVEAAHVK